MWRVCAFLPLVLLCGVLTIKAVEQFAPGDPAAEAASQQRNTGEVGQVRTQSPEAKQRKKRQAAAAKTSDAPTSEAPTSSTPAPESSRPAPSKAPSSNPPSHSPSSPSSPSPTPTPEEARDACEEAGVNPLDVAAMTACIARVLGG